MKDSRREISLIFLLIYSYISANMNDNEKLDNQRLKNFKNKGRDLEVSELNGAVTRRRAAGCDVGHKSSRLTSSHQLTSAFILTF